MILCSWARLDLVLWSLILLQNKLSCLKVSAVELWWSRLSADNDNFKIELT